MGSELDKIKKVSTKSQAIGDFIEAMQAKGISLCKYREPKNVCGKEECKNGCKPYQEDDCPNHHHDGYCKDFPRAGHYPLNKSIQQLLEEHFDIDAKKAEQERRKILEGLRKP